MGPDGGRRVTVILCNPAGELLGALPPLDLEVPWFPGVIDLVEAVRDTFGLSMTVLRLLDADRPPGPGGGARIVHLAQLDGRADVPPQVPLSPVPRLPAQSLADQPFRQAYARPGGPDGDLAWADRALAAGGMRRTGRSRQVRTWNLSCTWRIPTSAGDVWLKVVPPFFGHEGAMIALLGGVTEAVPPLLAHEPGRVLLGDVPGQDCYHAATPVLRRMVPVLVDAQAALVGRSAELLGTGAFDWRPRGHRAVGSRRGGTHRRRVERGRSRGFGGAAERLAARGGGRLRHPRHAGARRLPPGQCAGSRRTGRPRGRWRRRGRRRRWGTPRLWLRRWRAPGRVGLG